MVSKDQIKEHYEKHKTAYHICGGALLVVASVLITRGIMKKVSTESYARGVSDAVARGATSQHVNVGDGSSSLIFHDNYGKITTNIKTNSKGHPGFITKCLETGELFSSQKKAANAFGIPENVMSAHLNGKFPEADGHHFERVVVQ